MFTEAVAGPKSVFTQCWHKIDVISLYDNTVQKDKTRMSKLPTKLEKQNRPVTFHKQIKSSGYGGVPDSIKYSQAMKQRQAQKLSEPVYEVSKDFFGKPFPMLIPAELNVMNQTKLNKSSIMRLAYSYSGRYLAAASIDTTISLIRTPVFGDKLEYHSLQGHNGTINSLNFSANDQFLLSASTDKSCYVWNLAWAKKGEKLMCLDRVFRPRVSDMVTSNSSLIADKVGAKSNPKLNPEFSE